MSEAQKQVQCDHGILTPHECTDCFHRMQQAISAVAEAFGDNESTILKAISERPYGDGSQYMLHAQFAVRTQELLMIANERVAKLEQDCDMARAFREQLRNENIAAEAEVKRLRDALRDCQPILWHFAAMNPKFYSMEGSEQDPMGVHGLLPRIDAALAAQQAPAAKGE